MSESFVPYEELVAELNQLLARIEGDQTSVDELGQAVGEAYDKVSALKQRLSATETQLREVIALREDNLAEERPSSDTEH